VILVDSSVWIDYFRGISNPQSDRLDALLGSEPLAIGDLIIAEVLQGCDADDDFNRVNDLLGSLVLVNLGGKDIAVQAAKNFRTLRAKGVTIRKTIDTIIATRCIGDRLSLLYRDKDFDPFVMYLGLQSAMAEE
jgi:predicted nucleic acid-binding protein